MHPAWRQWVDDNLTQGASPAEVVAGLVDEGFSAREALDTVEAVAAAASERMARIGRKLERLAALHRAQRRAAGHGIERVAGLSPEAFFARYYATLTPVVITDLVPRWAAFGRWSLDSLRARFGQVEIAVARGREADVDYDLHTARLSTLMPLGAYCDLIESRGPTNDHYAVAQHHNSDREGLAPLFDEVSMPDGWLDPARRRGATALWIGPAATVTPLHHDTCNILFCSVLGQKRFTLAAPHETVLFAHQRGCYSRLDPERRDDPRVAAVDWLTVDLDAGEALYLPTGWWHHVRALSVSINLAFTNFARANAFDWYRPGEVV
ncbi:MAG: cupin-like domain-containing protein [Myxococcales bacterium]|nr:cupin-like domain-containing protein [Myxococcales bacterium]